MQRQCSPGFCGRWWWTPPWAPGARGGAVALDGVVWTATTAGRAQRAERRCEPDDSQAVVAAEPLVEHGHWPVPAARFPTADEAPGKNHVEPPPAATGVAFRRRLLPWTWWRRRVTQLSPPPAQVVQDERALVVLSDQPVGRYEDPLWRTYVDGVPLVLGTAQDLGLAEETWQGALSMAEGVPELAAELAHVSRTNGDKYLRLVGGERCKATAATRGGGRGLSSDLVLLDELRENLDWEAWSAVTKTTSARPSPQVLGFSNAGDRQSIVLSSLRDKALSTAADRTSTLSLCEWSAPDGCALDDRSAWAAANPALGHRMTERAIAAALEVDPEPVFRTEVLCQWVAAVEPAISEAAWQRLTDGAAPRGRDVVWALDVAPDHSTASLDAAWRRADGATQVMLANHHEGVDWVVDRAASVLRSWGGRLVFEQTGTAASLLPLLEPAGATVDAVPRRFYADACSTLDAAVTHGSVRHGNQPELTAAVTAARWSSSGDTGHRVLSRKDRRVSGLVAAALALHGLNTTPQTTGGWVMAL